MHNGDTMRRFPFLIVLTITTTVLLGSAIGQQTPSSKAQPKKKRRKNPVLQSIEDVAGLPRILLIGDSISMGYTLPVRKQLKDLANVHRPPTNCGPTTRGLEQMKKWLGSKRWDVIHFNWGLHDLKYIDSDGKLVDPATEGSRPQVSIEDYEKNLRKLVQQLNETKAKLIWASTTPVPEGADGRIAGDAVKYNAVAKKVMDEHQIQINDLYAFSMQQLEKIQKPANVHFHQEGSKELANQVVAMIKNSIETKSE